MDSHQKRTSKLPPKIHSHSLPLIQNEFSQYRDKCHPRPLVLILEHTYSRSYLNCQPSLGGYQHLGGYLSWFHKMRYHAG